MLGELSSTSLRTREPTGDTGKGDGGAKRRWLTDSMTRGGSSTEGLPERRDTGRSKTRGDRRLRGTTRKGPTEGGTGSFTHGRIEEEAPAD
jgi:hypothetical protein